VQREIACLTILVVLFISGCNRQPGSEAGDAEAPRSDGYFRTHFQDESQFIVETIITDLAEMASFQREKQISRGLSVAVSERGDSEFRKPAYDIHFQIGGLELKPAVIKINRPIWSPSLYGPMAAILLGQATPLSKLDPDDRSVLTALTDLRPAKLEAENLRISQLLEESFSDPTLHEMAAVILGAFGLRDFSGDFHDVRLTMCRMTAHLAMARTLSGNTVGLNGQMAEVMLATLMNNQTVALDNLKALAKDAGLQPWVRALRARNTMDYRELKSVENPTLLEMTSCYWASSKCLGSSSGWDEFPAQAVRTFADFSRIAWGAGYSVGLGHELRESNWKLEKAEIATVYSHEVGGMMASDRAIVDFLNRTPERCFLDGGKQVRIVGPGLWADFLQRHLCHSLQHEHEMLQHKWGIPEEAKDFRDMISKRWGSLRLYPFVQKMSCITKNDYHEAVIAGQAVTVATPQLVPAPIWNQLCNPLKNMERFWPSSHPHVNEWFKHNPLPGTAYNPAPRFYHPSLVDQPNLVEVLEGLNQQAPYDLVIADELIKRKFNGRQTYEQAEAIYHLTLMYNPHGSWQLAKLSRRDARRYEAVMLQYAALRPAGFFTLGRYFAERNDETNALMYYEKALAVDQDAVTMSNSVDWLVQYYFHNGAKSKAERIADRAAEVYSYEGLCTKARLMEVEMRHDEALKYFLMNEERYNAPCPVVGFCVRYRSETGDHRFDGYIKDRFTTLFPRGRETVEVGSFEIPPV